MLTILLLSMLLLTMLLLTMVWNGQGKSRGRIPALRAAVAAALLLLASTAVRADDAFVQAAPRPGEPTDLKARKTYASALEWSKRRFYDAAIGDFRKANKQDGGQCAECMKRAYRLSMQLGAYQLGAVIAREGLLTAAHPQDQSVLHEMLGSALLQDAINNRKQPLFAESAKELKTALQLEPSLAMAHYPLGQALAYMQQDDAAKVEFQAFLDTDHKNPLLHPRAERFLERVDLARAKMAPPFSVTTLDGQRISMDGLAGKVVLIDFWATWCGPCRLALPNIQHIAKKFEGQPLVVLSVSLDADDAAWRAFVEKNKMNWMQFRDGGFSGYLAKRFSVTAIPATFSIDADGVLEDQHVGDAAIEGKLKKMVAQAQEQAAAQAKRPPLPAASPSAEQPAVDQ